MFKDCYEFDHVTSSPTYPQSNGKAENVVKTAQRIMLKALEAGSDPYLGLLDFRNTPTEGLGTCPAQRLFGRRTKTLLPTAGKLLTQPEFDTTSQLHMPKKTNNLSITTRALKNSGHLNPEAPFVSIHPNIVINGPKQRLTNKLVYAHTKSLVTTEGCIAGTGRHLRLTAEVPKQSPPDIEVSSSDPGTLPLTKVEQEPPVAESMPQEVVKPQAAPGPPAHNISSPERCSTRGRVLRRPAYLSDYAC